MAARSDKLTATLFQPIAWAVVSNGKCRPATSVSVQITSCCEGAGVTIAESSPIPKLTSDFDARLKY